MLDRLGRVNLGSVFMNPMGGWEEIEAEKGFENVRIHVYVSCGVSRGVAYEGSIVGVWA